MAVEPISKSTVHDLVKKVSSMVTIASEPRYRRCIAVDETKVKGVVVYVWSAVDVDSGELLALEASYGRSCLNASEFLKKALKNCLNKPRVIIDRGPWYIVEHMFNKVSMGVTETRPRVRAPEIRDEE